MQQLARRMRLSLVLTSQAPPSLGVDGDGNGGGAVEVTVYVHYVCADATIKMLMM
jgi:hypothetical protein